MKRHAFAWGAGLLCAAFLAGQVVAQEKPAKKEEKKEPAKSGTQEPARGHEGQMTPEQQAEREAWAKAAQPGPEHKLLDYMVGAWDVNGKFWMSPEDEPTPISGTSDAKWILGGRFVHYVFKGDDPEHAFEGSGCTGYDNIQKKYISIWMDTEMTGWVTDVGTYDAAAKTFTYTGEFRTPMGQTVKSRSTIKLVSNDEHVLTMYHTKPGQKENRVMELVYKRAGTVSKPPPPKQSP